MKVLLLTDGVYPFVLGGMQKHSYYLIKYLSQNNVQLEVAHSSSNINIERSEFENVNITIGAFKSFYLNLNGKIPGHYIRANKIYSSLIYDYYIHRINEFDLIYAQGFTGWKFIKERKKGNITTPVVTNLHGYEMYQKAPSFKVKLQHLLLRPISKYVSVNADYVFSFGGNISRILRDIGVNKMSILECPIGIESHWVKDSVSEENSKRVFVFIGRNERRKGIIELNKAIRRINRLTAFEFIFIGPINDEDKVLDERVRYMGAIFDETIIRDVLWRADVLVCPSYSEGMPTVIMEGMSCGLAIIATDVGAVNQQVNTQNGWLLKEPSVDLIYSALTDAINLSVEKLLDKKKHSIEHVKDKFLWSNVVHKKIDLMNVILGKKNQSK